MTKTLRVGIIAGEASGDILGAGLISELKQLHPNIIVEGIAGPRMIAAGCHALFPAERLAVMGLVEVLGRVPELWNIRRHILKHFKEHPPDVFIGIDSPDFNLPVERQLKEWGIKTVHYNSPTVWAWRPNRIFKIKQSTDLMLTLFPFEAPIYDAHQIAVRYVGHPLADQIPFESDARAARQALHLPVDAKIIALLPGSRINELKYLAEVFIRAAKWCHEQQGNLVFATPMVNPKLRSFFEAVLRKVAPDLPITIHDGQSQEIMRAADAVLLASGTATLEALLLKKPMVVAYRLAPVTSWIAKRLIKLQYFSLPNLLSQKNLVPEFIQDAATPAALGAALLNYIDHPEQLPQLLQEYQKVHLSLKQNASKQAAEAVLQLINQKPISGKA